MNPVSTAPDARDLRYRILRALRPHVAGLPNAGNFDRLLENVPGFGLHRTGGAREG